MLQPIEYFKKVSAIPHGSGNEKAIADYIEEIAKKNGLFCIRDAFNNVFVRRKASVGYGDAPSVLFAAHTDMVCEKTPASTHDFLTDPLDIREKDGFIYAEGTTLGADDGAGVATMLSLMTDTDLAAPETEYLFTSSEETGMDGAFGFDYSVIRSEKVINLDNGAECSACTGSASGQRFEVKIPLDRTRKSGKAVKVTVSGLAGGHSGNEIGSGRQSAVKLLSALLCQMYEEYPFNLVSIIGGGKYNVIPTEASATVVFCGTDEEKTAKATAAAFEGAARLSLCDADKKRFKVSFSRLKEAENVKLTDMLTLKSTSTVLTALELAPQGVLKYFPNSHSVLSSVNLGILLTEAEHISVHFLARSAYAHEARITAEVINRLAHAVNGKNELLSEYPCWEYRKTSPLQDEYAKACESVFGRTPTFGAVHAGLECGIFFNGIKANGRSPDIISIGPNLYDIHSPKERMEIASLDRLYTLLKTMLGSAK